MQFFRLLLFIGIAVIAAGIGFFPSQESSATECYAPNPEKNFEEADVVFSGTVIGIVQRPDYSTTVTFVVSETQKGETEGIMVVESNSDWATGCGIRFVFLESYLVYTIESNGRFFTDANYGTQINSSVMYLVLIGAAAFVIIGIIITVIVYFVYKIIKKHRKKRKIGSG